MKVIVDRHRKAALLVKQGHTWLHVLLATPHGLEVRKITEEMLVDDWSELPGYDMQKAMSVFRVVSRLPRSTQAGLDLLAEAERKLEGEQHEINQAAAG
jgi:hypothetical protein